MGFSDPKLTALLLKETPEKFWRRLIQEAEQVYREGYERAKNDPLLESPEARYILPHMRRVLFEAKLRAIARECNLVTTTMDNAARNCGYSVVRAGRFVFTESAVHSGNELIRPAIFRKQLAAVNDFLRAPTLAFMNPPEIFAPDEIYAIIVHRAADSDAKQVGFVGIGVPSSDNLSWLERPWNLNSLIQEYGRIAPKPASNEDDRAFPKPKQNKKKGENDE